jgi:hypothetical protein
VYQQQLDQHIRLQQQRQREQVILRDSVNFFVIPQVANIGPHLYTWLPFTAVALPHSPFKSGSPILILQYQKLLLIFYSSLNHPIVTYCSEPNIITYFTHFMK